MAESNVWICPNGCKMGYVLVCGGPSDANPDSQNVYIRMSLSGDHLNQMADGTQGIPEYARDHANGGCCDEAQCPECGADCRRGEDADMYENPSLFPVFWTPYEQYAEHIGKKYEVLGQVDPKTYDAGECGPQWNIRLEDGIEIVALPEEIIRQDVELNGGHYPDLNPVEV